MNMAALPLDTIETIVEIISIDYPQVLGPFSLVCHAFLPICRKHIFASVTLDTSCEKLSKRRINLSCIPTIACYIQDLYFVISVTDFNDHTIPAAFKHFTRLQSVKFVFISSFSKAKGPWTSSPLRLALLYLLRLPSLISLLVYGIEGFILEDLACCPNLQSLDLDRVEKLSTAPAAAPDAAIVLHSLSIDMGCSPMVVKIPGSRCADGQPLANFSKLTKLQVSLAGEFNIHSSQALFSLCICLTAVEISVHDSNINLAGLSDILRPCQGTLKNIGIYLFFFEDGDVDDPMCNLYDEIKNLGDNENIIETIDLEVNLTGDSECTLGSKWRKLDQAFATARWPKLQHVLLTFSVDCRERDGSFWERLHFLRENHLPWLSSNESFPFYLDIEDSGIWP